MPFEGHPNQFDEVFMLYSQITFLLALCVDLGIRILKKAHSSKNYVIN